MWEDRASEEIITHSKKTLSLPQVRFYTITGLLDFKSIKSDQRSLATYEKEKSWPHIKLSSSTH